MGGDQNLTIFPVISGTHHFLSFTIFALCSYENRQKNPNCTNCAPEKKLIFQNHNKRYLVFLWPFGAKINLKKLNLGKL